MYSKFPFLNEENLGEICEKSQELIYDFKRLEDIRNKISKLRKAKERTYQQYFELMTKDYRKSEGIELDPKKAIFFYHGDEESYEQGVNFDKKFVEMAISESHITKMPSIITVTNEPTLLLQLVNRGSSLDRRIKKICNKLDNIISDTKKLKSESEIINIDLEEGKCLLNGVYEKCEKLKDDHDSIKWYIEEVRETRDILQKRYEEKIGKLQPKLKEMVRSGFRFDVFKGWFYNKEAIEGISKTKPEIKYFWCDEDIIQLVEESFNIDNLSQAEKILSEKEFSINVKLKRAENLTKELEQIVS